MRLTYRHTKLTCYTSYFTQAIVNCFLPLLFIVFQEQYGLSYEQLGTLVFLNFAVQMIVDALAARYADRIGYRILLTAAHICCAVGFAMIASAALWPADRMMIGLLLAVLIYSCGGGLLEVLVSPLLEHLPGDASGKASEMGFLHAAFCCGQVVVITVTTLAIHVAGRANWWLLPLLWTLVPLGNLLLVPKIPLPEIAGAHQAVSLRKLFASGIFRILCAGMLCAGAIELIMAQWASIFVESGLKVSKTMGDLLGPALFAVMMGAGRVAYGILGKKRDLIPMMLVGSVGCVIAYLLVILPAGTAVNVLGCALVGLSVSFMWPGILSVAAQQFVGGGTGIFAVLAMAGDVGGSAGPWLAGLLADHTAGGLKTGLMTGVAFSVIILVCLLVFQRQRKDR